MALRTGRLAPPHENGVSSREDDLDMETGKARAFGRPAGMSRARVTSYALVLTVGLVMLIGFSSVSRSAAHCDCPQAPQGGAFGAGVPAPGGSAGAALDPAGSHTLPGDQAFRAATETPQPPPKHAAEYDKDLKAKPVPQPPSAGAVAPTPKLRGPFTPRRIQPTPIESVLITGAAGFIGSHFALLLLDQGGFKVTAVDDMSRSSWDTVLRLQDIAASKGNEGFKFFKQDLSDRTAMAELMRERAVDAVVHFAGNAYVGESMQAPDKYFQNITVGTLSLLQAMDAAGVRNLIFSSSCATYGEPLEFPITEETPQRPTNPYGLSKLHAEQSILSKSAVRKKAGQRFAVASLRYFNVIGADPAGRMGPVLGHKEQFDFPRIVDAAIDAALGTRKQLMVMGDKFPTRDGTAIRDYIHVSDLVRAHLDALRRLDPDEPLVYNVGVGQGYTVKEVVKVVEKVSGRRVPFEIGPQRPGDPHTLYSDPSKIMAELGWKPDFADLLAAVRTSWQWRVDNYPSGPVSTIDPLAYSGPAYTPETDTAPPLKDDPHILIVGAGPTGICAAYRLKELGYTNWKLIDKSMQAGGLATSITDDKGFVWDIGVHVLFSHFEFFDALLDEYLQPKDWLYHQRSSPAWMRKRWVGYPIQSNVWRLPEDEVAAIVADLATLKPDPGAQPRNFLEWLHNGFGKALTKTFMAPYNFKVWAHPPEQLNTIWVGERVATIKFGDILSNVINRRDAPAWGPNAQFRYPMNGTGHIWQAVFDGLPKEHITLGAEMKSVHVDEGGGGKKVRLADGSEVPFDAMLSTVPVDQLLKHGFPERPELKAYAEGEDKFKHQTVNLVGVGINGEPPPNLNGVHWVYFPEEEYPFYRVTVLSNFSPLVVPKPLTQWSLLVEVSESKYRPVPSNVEELKAKVLEGLRKATMLPEGASVESVWSTRLEYGYPVPYVERNMHMHRADKELRKMHIWSRGRFGSWKYEVANQDHSCMLGVDAVDAMLFGGNDEGVEATFNTPNKVNVRYRKYDRQFDPAKLQEARPRSDGAPRRHTKFEGTPVRLEPLTAWAAVSWHCHDADDWAAAFKALVPDRRVKYFAYSYERCGFADTKRPMKDMLYEGLHHLDRIPFGQGAHGTNASALPHHLVQHYGRLPERLLFVRPGLAPEALAPAADARAWMGADARQLGAILAPGASDPAATRDLPVQGSLCAVYKAALGSADCPAAVSVGPPWAALLAARERVLAVPKERWQALEQALDAVPAAEAEAAEALVLGLWPAILGGKATFEKADLFPVPP